MKYHYFHGRFTYSVKRSGPAAGGGRSRFSLRAIAVLDSCVEACAVSVGSAGAGCGWSCGSRVVRPAVLAQPSSSSGSLFGDAIRAEDIAGWGV